MPPLQAVELPNGDSDSYELNSFLAHLSNALASSDTHIIFPMEVAYTSQLMMNRDVNRQLDYQRKEFNAQMAVAISQGTPISDQEIGEFEGEMNKLERNLSNFGLISNAIRFYKRSKCNYFLMASPPNICWIRSQAFKSLPCGKELLDALQRHQERRADWHAFAIRIQEQKIYIYDPSYEAAQNIRLKDIPYLSRAKDLRTEMKKANKAVKSIWIGGGGNDWGVCQDMACRWLLGEIIHDLGEGDHMRVPVDFVEIQP